MDLSGYHYSNAEKKHSQAYLLPAVLDILQAALARGAVPRVFDLGCGAGAVANELSARGIEVVGVDPSKQGIEQAQKAYPHLRLYLGSTEEDLAAKYGTFPFVLSLEVIEHVYAPRQFMARAFQLLEPGGQLILSTPYHGYFKNLLLALSGKLDAHFTALWDNGHIKFWSIRTLSQLVTEAGLKSISFTRVGRISVLAKSMILVAMKPKV